MMSHHSSITTIHPPGLSQFMLSPPPPPLKIHLLHTLYMCSSVYGAMLYMDIQVWSTVIMCICSHLQFCDDMRLMFDNAWLYNRKTSRVYKYCSKLSEVFESNIDIAMQSLGYCCGQRVSYII